MVAKVFTTGELFRGRVRGGALLSRAFPAAWFPKSSGAGLTKRQPVSEGPLFFSCEMRKTLSPHPSSLDAQLCMLRCRPKINKRCPSLLVLLTKSSQCLPMVLWCPAFQAYYPQFTDEEVEAQREEVAYLMSHTEKWHSPDLVSQSCIQYCNRLMGTPNA